MAGLYIHIPFCKQACHYCDFHFSTDQRFRSELIKALTREIIIQKNYLGSEPVKTIYFGGGTPSLCSPEEVALLISTIRSTFSVIAHPEITLEANPDDLSTVNLEALKISGINRLSIGIQSFDDDVLHFLNRAHSSAQAAACLQDARAAGFSNISLDLIYAIPGQDDEAWKKNIRKAISFSPEHLSCYSLTIEEKTVFGKLRRTGKFQTVPDDTSAEQFEQLMDILEKAGYDHYEISNFARPGYPSQHNSSYWQQEKYLGIGPSAHSYNGNTRQANVSNNAAYTRAIQQDEVPFEREELTRENKINEYLLTTLRTAAGCDLEQLRIRWDFDILKEKQEYLDVLYDHGYVIRDGSILRLTRKGKLLADKIASDLFSAID